MKTNKQTFLLQTTPILFTQWLGHHVEQHAYIRHLPNRDVSYWTLCKVVFPASFLSPIRLTIDGDYHERSAQAQLNRGFDAAGTISATNVGNIIHRSGLIDITTVQLAAERVEISVQSNAPELESYCDELLKAIRACWPETELRQEDAAVLLLEISTQNNFTVPIPFQDERLEPIRVCEPETELRHGEATVSASEVENDSGAEQSGQVNAPILPGKKRRRGGPIPTSLEKKKEIVLGWLEVEGNESQISYAQRKGVSESTLRKWRKELEDMGELPLS